MRSTYKIAIAFALLMSGVPTEGNAQCSFSSRTGEWKSNDGGIYHVREFGNELWWVGLSPDGGRQYTNVFKGVFNSDKTLVEGSWVDVRGAQGAKGFGSMQLRVNGTASLQKVSSSGGAFGATSWVQPCHDTNQVGR
jgi:hypothetical protein